MDASAPNETEVPGSNKKKRSRSQMKPDPIAQADLSLNSSIARTVGQGITHPPPQASRVQVKKFRQVSQTLNSIIEDRIRRAPESSHFVDLDVSDLRYRSPEIAVAEAITKAASRPDFSQLNTEELVNQAHIPNFEELNQRESKANLQAIEHIKFVRSTISKVRNKHVNYLATAIEGEKIAFAPLDPTEIILSVALYAPRSLCIIQEFLVYSSQTLTKLKDLFYCVQDQPPSNEQTAGPAHDSTTFSSLTRTRTPPLPSPVLPNNTFDSASLAATVSDAKNTSGYMFIGDTFYSDTRIATNSEYAETTQKWIESGQSPYWSTQPPPQKAAMENARFEDLTVQLGKKYLYVHRGHCEHVIVFTAVRALTDADDMNANAYPKQIYQAKYRQRRCTICDRAVAKWITSGDSFSIEDPTYYCDTCFDMAHRAADGSIIDTGFKLLPYLHD